MAIKNILIFDEELNDHLHMKFYMDDARGNLVFY